MLGSVVEILSSPETWAQDQPWTGRIIGRIRVVVLVGRRLPVADAFAFRALVVVVVVGLALVVATSAFGGGRAAFALDRVSLVTHDVAVPSSAKPKKKPPVCKKGQKSTKSKPCTKPPPVCKKGQKSTKGKPCTKRLLQVVDSRANPPVAGWMFGFGLSQNTDGSWSLSVSLSRTVGNATETHRYAFQLAASSVAVASDLSTLTLDTGAQLGQFGVIKLTFANPGSLTPGTAPFGCTTGTWQTRAGTLTGSVSFAADSSYFKTIVEKSLPADLTANTSGTPATCGTGPPPTCTHSTSIFAGNPTIASGAFIAILTNGQLELVEELAQSIAPAQILHVLTETNVPTSDLTAAADSSTGAVTTGGASPWFTGSLNFTASGPPTTFGAGAPCAGGTFTQGTVAGSLVAHFAAIPATTLTTGTSLLDQV